MRRFKNQYSLVIIRWWPILEHSSSMDLSVVLFLKSYVHLVLIFLRKEISPAALCMVEISSLNAELGLSSFLTQRILWVFVSISKEKFHLSHWCVLWDFPITKLFWICSETETLCSITLFVRIRWKELLKMIVKLLLVEQFTLSLDLVSLTLQLLLLH